MIYLFLCIFFSTMIFVVFRLLDRLKVDTLNAIIINYFTASLLGFAVSFRNGFVLPDAAWVHMAVILGILFVLVFIAIGYSSRVAGITITSLTTKLSVVIPVIFSIYIFGEHINAAKITGMIMALMSVALIVYKPAGAGYGARKSGMTVWLPVILFFGAGLVDSLIKYSQELFVPGDEIVVFSSATFLTAAVTSILFRLARPRPEIRSRWYNTAAGGISLGLANFGSLYFLIMALESGAHDSSVIFGINNIGIVMLSVLAGLFLFREKTTIFNRVGIFTAVVSIIILFYS